MEEDTTNEEEDFAAVSENEATLSRTPPGANAGKAGQPGNESEDGTNSNSDSSNVEKEKEKEKVTSVEDEEREKKDKGEAGWEPVVLNGPWKDMVDRKEPPDNEPKKAQIISPQEEAESGWSQLKNLQALYEQGSFIVIFVTLICLS